MAKKNISKIMKETVSKKFIDKLLLILKYLAYNKLTYNISSKNFRSKNNFLYEENRPREKSKFLMSNNDEYENTKNDIRTFPLQEKNLNYKLVKYQNKPKTCFNTSSNNNSNKSSCRFNYNYNTNRERTRIIFDERNSSNVNDSMSKYINVVYEDKINKLKEEIKELRNDKENIKSCLILFISMVKKYSNKLSFLLENINLNNYEHEQIISIFFNLNEFIEKIETNNFNLEDNINMKKLFAQNSLNESQEIEKNVNEIISKYERKINIIKNQNKEMSEKIKMLKDENTLLKQQSEEENNIKENMLNKLNMMKELNNILDKKNKTIDSKNRVHLNQSARTKYDQINCEEEIDYKNKIINYLEDLLQKKDLDQKDEIFKKINDRNLTNINKIIDLKKNLKKVINATRNINNTNNDENDKSSTSNDKNNMKKNNLDNGSRYLNEKSISSFSYRTNNAKVKKEIDLLDKEIEQIQTKLENLIEND